MLSFLSVCVCVCVYVCMCTYVGACICTYMLFFYKYQREKGMITEQTMLIKKEKDFVYTYVHVKGQTDDHTVMNNCMHHTQCYCLCMCYRCYILTRRIHWRYTCMLRFGLSTKQDYPCSIELVYSSVLGVDCLFHSCLILKI